jgi:hypothetical protein
MISGHFGLFMTTIGAGRGPRVSRLQKKRRRGQSTGQSRVSQQISTDRLEARIAWTARIEEFVGASAISGSILALILVGVRGPGVSREWREDKAHLG